jgi:Domain of unknown function (DUF4173)
MFPLLLHKSCKHLRRSYADQPNALLISRAFWRHGQPAGKDPAMTEAAILPAALPPPLTAPIERAPLKIGLAALLVLLADQLFYGHQPGISVSLFLLAIVAGVWWVQRPKLSSRHQALGIAVALIGALPAAVEASALSVLIALLAAGLAALVLSGKAEAGWQGLLRQLVRLFGLGPFQIIGDVLNAPRSADLARVRASSRGVLLVWAMPLLLGLAFLWLFAEANPLIGNLVAQIEWAVLTRLLNPDRLIFWGMVLALVWPLLHLRLKARVSKAAVTAPHGSSSASLADFFFSDASILRALILFNLLFAAQSAMDCVYLFNGFALPQGMTYAAYAHRGAYPLVITALLAAAFVLVTLRDGGTAEKSPVLSSLLYLFVAQNILLVLSSVYRLKLYVETYSLTLLRLSAFIWMLLVILGLVLIIIRMVQRRSNGWLVGMNLAALCVTLYACCFVNFATVIGNYNVKHERTIGRVDIDYIASFGAQAIPVLDRYIARFQEGSSDPQLDRAIHRRNMRAKYFLLGSALTWPAWTLRDHRIRQYLDRKPVIRSPVILGLRTN